MCVVFEYGLQTEAGPFTSVVQVSSVSDLMCVVFECGLRSNHRESVPPFHRCLFIYMSLCTYLTCKSKLLVLWKWDSHYLTITLGCSLWNWYSYNLTMKMQLLLSYYEIGTLTIVPWNWDSHYEIETWTNSRETIDCSQSFSRPKWHVRESFAEYRSVL